MRSARTSCHPTHFPCSVITGIPDLRDPDERAVHEAYELIAEESDREEGEYEVSSTPNTPEVTPSSAPNSHSCPVGCI